MLDETLALLLSDGYKQVHAEQFPNGTDFLVSYFTPRKSRLQYTNRVVFFGLQAFCKKYLIDYFKRNFFDIPLDDVIESYTRILDVMLGRGNYDIRKVVDLHKLGYLPLSIHALPEGTRVPMKVPFLEITNTLPGYAWVVQWVESLMSSELWKSCVHATVGAMYREVVGWYYGMTVDDSIPKHKAISDFGFRGMSCLDEATKASAAWLLSFSGTATIPAVPYLEKYYNCDCTKELVATNAISTEHSVMASNFAVDGDERTFVKRLLTEVYPHASFSMVSDTYDYWNMIDNIIPSLKEEILAHDGKLLVRPDSGNIIDISINTIKHLWNTFGGTVNTKGYKVLDSHIGCVYGDGVTQERAKAIYKGLMEAGFASNNIVFGAGSFSFNGIMEDGEVAPLTRDTFNMAVKCTGAIINGKFVPVFKDPKTDREPGGDNMKKSLKGYCIVTKDEKGMLICEDGFNEQQSCRIISCMNEVFKDGRMVMEESLQEIRNRLNNNKF